MHLPVAKTYKLFIKGAFARSESGRSAKVHDAEGRLVAHLCQASRKDLRDAVEAARGALTGWAGRTGYNRGQILYRLAEMLEGRQAEFVEALAATGPPDTDDARHEVELAIDRLVCFAGWTDKLPAVLGGCNPVAAPFYNQTVVEPTGVVAVIVPDEPALLALVTLLAAPLCAGNTLVVVAGLRHPLPAALFGELCATSDVPPGVINLLTADRAELLSHIANHRDIDAISSANLGEEAGRTLKGGTEVNLKRVRTDHIDAGTWLDDHACASPWRIEPFIELKTIWHPSAV